MAVAAARLKLIAERSFIHHNIHYYCNYYCYDNAAVDLRTGKDLVQKHL